MNPFLLRLPSALERTPIRAERPDPKAGDSAVALRLYDPIDSWGGDWGVSAKEFVAVLDELPEDTGEIHVLINSPGGEVWEGLAILNALRAHPARVVAVVEGIAASAASFVAAGVDELRMMSNSELFVHNAWGLCIGNAADATKLAADLEHEDRNLASIYAEKSGGTTDDWLARMAAETWMSADEAVEAGLADSVVKADSAKGGAAKARARFNLAPLVRGGRQTPAAAAVGSTEEEGSRAVAFSDEQLTTMRQRLGLADDADESTIVAAFEEALDEQATEPAPAAPAASVRPQLPEGVTTIEQTTLDELRASARRGEEARTQQEREGRERVVDAAIESGRIAPARRDAWLARLQADPAEAETLNALEPGLATPVGAPLGHDGPQAQTDPARGDDYWFPGVYTPPTSKEG